MLDNNNDLVNHIKRRSSMYLDNIERSEKILDAMRKVDRIKFLPRSVRRNAYEDIPLPIGDNQTCSQPSMVAFMLDKLNIEIGNIVLEIGAGCGYAAAIASILCKPSGMVYASEIIPELVEIMRNNLAPYTENIIIFAKDGSSGFIEYAPFDRIFISAGVASEIFDENILLSQLSDNGVLLYPEMYGNIYVIKKVKNELIKDVYHGVSFVPLRGKNS